MDSNGGHRPRNSQSVSIKLHDVIKLFPNIELTNGVPKDLTRILMRVESNHARVPTSIVSLPPELTNEIFNHFKKAELKELRLVCKHFERSATPLLFDHVSISNNNVSLQIAKAIVGTFSSSIKTILFENVFYPEFSFQDYYLKITRKNGGILRKPIGVETHGHIERAHQAYSRLAAEQKEISESGRGLAVLSVVLSTCTNARVLAFGTHSADSGMDLRKLGIVDGEFCSIPNCVSPDETAGYMPEYSKLCHTSFFFHKPETCFRQPMGEFWYPAMVALAESSSQITEIDMCSDHWGWEDGLSIQAFNSTQKPVKYVRDRLGMLTKLHLQISVDTADPTEEASYLRCDVAKLLSEARNLEDLWLCANLPDNTYESLDWYGPIPFGSLECFLGDCQLPKLRSLILQNFQASEAEISALLNGLPRLQTLFFSAFALTAGSWERVAHRMRRIPNLKKILLHWLRGFARQNPADAADDWLASNRPTIDDFFFRGGENPFTPEAMARLRYEERERRLRGWRYEGDVWELIWTARARELEEEYYDFGPRHWSDRCGDAANKCFRCCVLT